MLTQTSMFWFQQAFQRADPPSRDFTNANFASLASLPGLILPEAALNAMPENGTNSHRYVVTRIL